MIRRMIAAAAGVMIMCAAPLAATARDHVGAQVVQGDSGKGGTNGGNGHDGTNGGNGHTDHGNGNGYGHDEAYPFNPPSLTVKPNYCTSGNISGSVMGAVPGSNVTLSFVFTLTSGSNKVEYGQKIVANATSVVITATGISRQSNTAFSVSVTLDLTGCKACKKQATTSTSSTTTTAPKSNNGKKPTTTSSSTTTTSTTVPKNDKSCKDNENGHSAHASGNCGSKSLWVKAACQHKR
jgi:hypothetical protein